MDVPTTAVISRGEGGHTRGNLLVDQQEIGTAIHHLPLITRIETLLVILRRISHPTIEAKDTHNLITLHLLLTQHLEIQVSSFNNFNYSTNDSRQRL